MCGVAFTLHTAFDRVVRIALRLSLHVFKEHPDRSGRNAPTCGPGIVVIDGVEAYT